MIRFLREDRLGAEFRRIGAGGGEVAVAAPFWGRGAAKLLGLRSAAPIRILCRFDAPACNPEELLNLSKLGAKIRTHPRLHAKTYLTRTAVIVGSSNPSRYGLTQEGDTVGGTIEGNILTTDPAILKSTWALFEELWEDRDETCAVTRRMIEREIERRALLPPPLRPRVLRARRLLTACREAPELFTSVVVGAYDSSLDPGGRAALRALQNQVTKREAAVGAADFRKAWGYQFDEGPPAGAWVVDLDCRAKMPRVRGASQVPSPALRLKVEGENDVTPTVRGVIVVPGAIGEFRIYQQDRDELASVAKKLLRANAFLPLPEVVRMIDRKRVTMSAGAADLARPALQTDVRRAFALAYAALAAEITPGLKLRPSNDGDRANTGSFEKLKLRKLGGVWPRHEFGPGTRSKYVNVLLQGAAGARETVRASGILEGTGYQTHAAGKSLAIRASTPSIDPTRSFDGQREKVEQGLSKLSGLVGWVSRNESSLASLIRSTQRR